MSVTTFHTGVWVNWLPIWLCFYYLLGCWGRAFVKGLLPFSIELLALLLTSLWVFTWSLCFLLELHFALFPWIWWIDCCSGPSAAFMYFAVAQPASMHFSFCCNCTVVISGYSSLMILLMKDSSSSPNRKRSQRRTFLVSAE